MNTTALRLAAAAALVYFALTAAGGGGLSVAVAPYAGTLPNVHTASRVMAAADRRALSEALTAAGEMLGADNLGLVGTTEEMQTFVKACLEFDYQGLGKPSAKYPSVARAVQADISKAIGEDVAQVTPEKRAAVAAVLIEAGKAVR